MTEELLINLQLSSLMFIGLMIFMMFLKRPGEAGKIYYRVVEFLFYTMPPIFLGTTFLRIWV